ncbi:PIN domain protein [compost metagenome]
MSYFDSAFIVKFYVDEPESEAIRRLAESLAEVHCVQLGRIEAASAFHRKWREGAFTDAAFRAVGEQFADDCAAGLWQWLPATAALAEVASAAVSRAPKGLFLRAADALHLTCAREHGFKRIYSNDRHLLAAAGYFGLEAAALPGP